MRCMLVLCALLAAPLAPAADDAVLVFGGTGRLGAEVVAALVDAGHPVTVFARPSSDRGRLAGLDVDYVTGDLLDAASVVAALDGRHFAYAVDASARDGTGPDFYVVAMRHMLAALGDAGLRQFVLHGSVGAGDNRLEFPGMFDRMAGVSEAKGEAERLLRDSGLPYTIIRNGILLPDGTPATGTARLVDDPTVLARVTRADLGRLTVECLGNAACLGATLHAADDAVRR